MQAKCEDAHIDHYVDTIGSISQSPCPTGSSQPLVGQSKCVWPFGVESPAILFVSAGVIGILSLIAFLMIRRNRRVNLIEHDTID